MKQTHKITVFALLIMLFLSFGVARAQEEATPEPAGIDEINANLKERLKETIGGESGKSVTNTPRAYVGVVRDIIKNTIVVEDKDGKKNVILGDDSTIVRSPGSTEIKIDNVRIDDNLIAMGYPMGQDELDAKRLIVSTNPFTPPKKLSDLAEITKINKYSYTLKTGDQDDLEVFFTKNTTYKAMSGSLDQADMEIGDTILFTAVTDKDGDWSATQVLRLREPISNSVDSTEK